MANTKELKNRINSIKSTQKITNAMYLIASTKMQKAKKELDETRPYFDSVSVGVKRIFRTVKEGESRYFYPEKTVRDYPGTYGILVITADKGLAGPYNQNVIKEAMRLYNEHPDVALYVVGEYGRHYFESRNIPIEHNFQYTAQNPTLHRAREIATTLLERYDNGELVKIFVVYTDFKNAVTGGVARSNRLLPFHKKDIMDKEDEDMVKQPFEFVPSLDDVLANIMPSCMTGFIYSALVDSFCSEQNARMRAMDSANQNADKILDRLTLEYNHMRQGAITQEITEISSGAKSQKKH